MADPSYNEFFERQGSLPTPVSEDKRKQKGLWNLIQSRKESRGIITNSVELSRILALPRRPHDFSNIDDVTMMFRRPGGTMSFWPIQSAALIEAALADGLFAPIGVGFGKTLITLALPEAMDAERAVLLIPPALKDKTLRDIEFYSKHFSLPIDRIAIVKFSELSSAKKATILSDIGADLVIVDEAHALRHRSSARTKRVLRYARENPACRWAFLSGTMTTRSILDYAHLIELALRKNSPLPAGYRELKDWAGALDVNPQYTMMPGALRQLGGENAREGFRQRLVETTGVVATSETELGNSLLVTRRTPSVPPVIAKAIRKVRSTWAVGGEELSSALELWRVLRQLACGFFYRWVWQNDEPDYEWLDARAEWNKEVRQKLKQSLEGMDSPLLCAQAAERHYLDHGNGPRWASKHWAAWREQKHKPTPPTEAVWLSDFLVQESLDWASERDRAIIWYEHKVLGERIAVRSGLPLFAAGTDASVSTDPVIVCSMKTQGTGKNLQHYYQSLFTSMPPNGAIFEQVAGRTHREGQLADVVFVDWFGHTEAVQETLEAVIDDAKYIEETTGQRQKILYATRI
jgi:hypothetical protein